MSFRFKRFTWLLLTSLILRAQGPPPSGPFGGGHPPPPPPHHGGPPPGPLSRSLHVGPIGRWWTDPHMAQLLALTADQQSAMDRVFEQNRAKLLELNGNLRREEGLLKSLVDSTVLDEQKLYAQIDSVASARAELERANGRMLIGLRKILSAEQWQRLQADRSGDHRDGPPIQHFN